jgi:glycosyltransferase involved in cell wall biosynthesis
MKVSLCIPVYEDDKALRRSLTQLLKQTYTNWEAIITDDSKSDAIKNLVSEFNDSRISYLRNSFNLGSPENWNESIRHASGELIKIIHNDDWLAENNAIESFVKVFQDNPEIDIVFCQAYKDNGFRQSIYKAEKKTIAKIMKDPSLLLYQNEIGPPSVLMYKRSFTDLEYDRKTKWYVDVIFYMQFLKKRGCKMYYLQQPLIGVTEQSSFQITNKTPAAEKFREAVYTFKTYTNLKAEYKRLIFKITFIELLREFKIASLDEFDFTKEEKEMLSPLVKMSKIKVPHYIYSGLRRLLVKYIPVHQ